MQKVQEQTAGSAWPELRPAFPEPVERRIGLAGLGWPRQWSQGLQEMHTNFINKLVTASDGEWVIDPATSKRYQVLKLDPEVKAL